MQPLQSESDSTCAFEFNQLGFVDNFKTIETQTEQNFETVACQTDKNITGIASLTYNSAAAYFDLDQYK